MAGKPWEDYSSTPSAETGRPWEDYAAPTAPIRPQVDVTTDVVKSIGGGLGRGVAGTLGLGGDVGGYLRSGLEYAGVPSAVLEKGAAAARAMQYVPLYGNVAKVLTGPGSKEVTEAITPYTGEFYKPQTTPGQYASTIAEFAPGALLPVGAAGKLPQAVARAGNVVFPAVGSETAGQAFEGTGYEGPARMMGSVLGGVGGAKLITPYGAPPAPRQAAAATLEREGVPVTAGMATGSRLIRTMEDTALDMPGISGMASRLSERTKEGYDRALTNRTFERGELTARGVDPSMNLPSSEVFAAGKASLVDKYKQLQANTMNADPNMIRDMQMVENNYLNNTLPTFRGTGHKDIVEIRDKIIDHFIQNQGKASGEWYQNTRSALGAEAANAMKTNPQVGIALKGMRAALDNAMERSLSPADAAAWRDLNTRYGNMKKLENAVATGGEHLSPAAVAAGVRRGRAGQYAAGAGSLDELANAGNMLLRDLPSSGTAQRLSAGNPFNWIRAIPMGLAVSGPGQAYLGNQFAPQSMRDIIARSVLQQTIAQPESRR